MSRIGRPRAATVIAFVALLAAIGGTAYAGKANKKIKVTSKNIVDGTIKGKDVKVNALKGKQIAEGTLGKVPSAAQADNAATADSADTASQADSATTADTAGDADTVGGKSADELNDRWVLIGSDGTIQAQSGGFTLVDCYSTNANCYIDAGEDATVKAISAEIVTANNPDAGTDGLLTGETSAAPCFQATVNCAPPNTDDGNGGNNGVFVVAPRNSDGSAPAAGDRYAFYAFVSGASAEVPVR
jgi:hypothetical protein